MALDPIYIQLILALTKMYLEHQKEIDAETKTDLENTLRRLNARMEAQPDLTKK